MVQLLNDIDVFEQSNLLFVVVGTVNEKVSFNSR